MLFTGEELTCGLQMQMRPAAVDHTALLRRDNEKPRKERGQIHGSSAPGKAWRQNMQERSTGLLRAGLPDRTCLVTHSLHWGVLCQGIWTGQLSVSARGCTQVGHSTDTMKDKRQRADGYKDIIKQASWKGYCYFLKSLLYALILLCFMRHERMRYISEALWETI